LGFKKTNFTVSGHTRTFFSYNPYFLKLGRQSIIGGSKRENGHQIYFRRKLIACGTAGVTACHKLIHKEAQ